MAKKAASNNGKAISELRDWLDQYAGIDHDAIIRNVAISVNTAGAPIVEAKLIVRDNVREVS